MAKNPSRVDDGIVDLLSAMPMLNGRVYVGHVPIGTATPADNNSYINPYAVVFPGGLFDAGPSWRGIGTNRDNAKAHTVMVKVVASARRQASQVTQAVREVLQGQQWDGTTELDEITSTYSEYEADTSMRPARYEVAMVFALVID